MKGQFLKMSAVATLLVLGLLVGNTWAKKTGDPNKPSKPEYKNYKGIVEVAKDKAGKIMAVTLKVKVGKTPEHTYNVTLNEKGKELGEKMAGKKVIATGTLEKKAGAEWLTITKYSEVSSKSKKETPKK